MRVYTDDQLEVGARMQVDLLLENEVEVRSWARVAWIESLPDGSGAAFDIGLEFTDIADEDRAVLAAALRRTG